MKMTFDLDAILFGILNSSPLKSAINGGIYTGEKGRPNDSQLEDVTVNTPNLRMEYLPQVGYSNVNIYVPDELINKNGKWEKGDNRPRLKQLANLAVSALEQATILGSTITVESQAVLAEPAVEQHFVNIKVFWNIQN